MFWKCGCLQMVISCTDFKKLQFSHIEEDCIILQLEKNVVGYKDDVSVSCKKTGKHCSDVTGGH